MALKPIEDVLADTLERIATALEELVEIERTQPLEKIIHPSNQRPIIPTDENADWQDFQK
jgi:hypothetical protein